MARSRKSPPLFDVMGEAAKRAAGTVTPVTGRIAADSAELRRPVIRVVGGAEPVRTSAPAGYPRLPTPAPEHGPSTRPDWADNDDVEPGWRLFGLPAQYVLVAFSALVLVVSLTAMVSFRLGRAQEASDILGADHSGPPPVLGGADRTASPPTDRSSPGERQPDRPGASPKAAAPAPDPGAPQLPVTGDDPRQPGNNYLIVDRLTMKDAEPAARFLGENGVPAVVVPPQGVDAAKLSQDPRGNWWVIVRQGLTSEEFKAGDPRKAQLLAAVKKIGRRWKQDHKGSTDFSTAFWRLYGK